MPNRFFAAAFGLAGGAVVMAVLAIIEKRWGWNRNG